MDPVTLGMAKAAAKKSIQDITASPFAALRFKLDQGLENASFAVVGDSTGAGRGDTGNPKRWVFQFAQKIAAAYPAYTVNFRAWNINTTSYDATYVIQAGTGTGNAGGPFVLDIWNGSASGKTPLYSQQNTLAILPTTANPDVIVFNHGHNITQAADDNTVATYYAMVRDFLRFSTFRPNVVIMGQNPRVAPAANISIHMQRMNRLQELAAAEGWSFLNITQAFLDTPNYASLIEPTDGIHPTDAGGSALWASYVWDAFQRGSRYAVPKGQNADDRIWLNPNDFVPSLVVGGSPVIGAAGGFLPSIQYSKQASAIGASTTVHLPNGWRQVNIWVYWTTADGAAGNVVWRVDTTYLSRIGLDMASAASGTALTMAAGGGTATVATPGAALAQAHTLLSTGGAFTGSRNLVVRIVRDSGNAADTYAGTAHLYGVVIERAA